MITLISPPDIFENENYSILLMNISDQEQEEASLWLGKNLKDQNVNVYYYQGEPNIEWLLYAIALCKGVYLNCNNNSEITKWITSYVLGKSNVWYKSDDKNLVGLMSYINQKNIKNISEFLEVHFGRQEQNS
jgi:hypothetical protein